MKFTERSSCRLTLKRNSIHCVNVHFSTKYVIVHLDEIQKIILKMLVVSALCKVV